MKKILAVFLLLTIASICSAQVETGGLRIPGDGAVQVGRKTKVVIPILPPWTYPEGTNYEDEFDLWFSNRTTAVRTSDYVVATTASNIYSGASFGPGILTRGGKILLPAAYESRLCTFDYVNDSVYLSNLLAAQTFFDFWGSCLMPNEDVFLAPTAQKMGRWSTSAPTTLSSYTCDVGVGTTLRFNGAVLAPNGKVICAPAAANRIGIFDPDTNTIATGPTTPNYSFDAACVVSTGKVIFSPRSLNYYGIYDPYANTYTQGAAVTGGTGSGNFTACTQIPGKKIVSAPGAKSCVGLYDFINNTYSDGPLVVPSGSANCKGAAIQPNGRVLMTKANVVMEYDPLANTVTQVATLTPTGTYHGGVNLPDGRVFFPPYNTSYSKGYFLNASWTYTFTEDELLHPMFNKNQ